LATKRLGVHKRLLRRIARYEAHQPDEEDDESADEDVQEEDEKKGKSQDEIPVDKEERRRLKEETEKSLSKMEQLQNWLARWPVALYNYGMFHTNCNTRAP
jgi:hypothetical protein